MKKKIYRIRLLLLTSIILTALAATGCGDSSNQPKAVKINSKWLSGKWAAKFGSQKIVLKLKKDGSFTKTEIGELDELSIQGLAMGLMSKKGKWEFDNTNLSFFDKSGGILFKVISLNQKFLVIQFGEKDRRIEFKRMRTYLKF